VPPPHPPLGFPLYGLDHEWSGPRWLEFVRGSQGEPIWTADLCHSQTRTPQPGGPWVLIGVSPRSWHCKVMSAPGRDYEQDIALDTLLDLFARTTPSIAEGAARTYRAAEIRLIESQAASYTTWPTVTWHLDGKSLQARIYDWAGAWAGFTFDIPGVILHIVATGIAPADLRLAHIADSSAYHFDIRQPIQYPETLQASAVAALGAEIANPATWGWPHHHDHDQLLQSTTR
jgi:hypothetical protein